MRSLFKSEEDRTNTEAALKDEQNTMLSRNLTGLYSSLNGTTPLFVENENAALIQKTNELMEQLISVTKSAENTRMNYVLKETQTSQTPTRFNGDDSSLKNQAGLRVAQ